MIASTPKLISLIHTSKGYVLELNKTEQGTWSYCIKYNNKAFIKQEYIPGLQGKIPFESKNDAQKTGLLVLKKLKNKENPSCSITELEQLGVIPD